MPPSRASPGSVSCCRSGEAFAPLTPGLCRPRSLSFEHIFMVEKCPPNIPAEQDSFLHRGEHGFQLEHPCFLPSPDRLTLQSSPRLTGTYLHLGGGGAWWPMPASSQLSERFQSIRWQAHCCGNPGLTHNKAG